MSDKSRRESLFLGCVPWLVALCAAADACDVPVYQYALERWDREPYYVLCFAKGEESKAEAEVRKALLGDKDEDSFANLIFKRLDVEAVKKLGADSIERKTWERHQSRKPPFYLVLSPMGGEVFVGELTPDTAKRLLSSPKREDLAKTLCEGKMVLLLLRCGKKEEDETAAGVLREVRASAEAYEVKTAVIEVNRKDPAEEWLVRPLLSIEEDLGGTNLPMVFAVIGKGFAMPPYVGKGIAKENIEELVGVLAGPCTCDLKASRVGLDLLTNWDWEGWLLRHMQGEAAPLPLGVAAPPPEKPAVVKPLKPLAVAEKKTETEPATEPHLQSQVARNMLIAVGVLAVIVVVLGLVVWRRKLA